MKVKKTVFYILMFLPLLAVIVALQLLPEQIPAHFNVSGQVDRWGSKYETLVFPAVTVIMGMIMLVAADFSSKQEGSGKNNENICIIAGIFSLFIFNVMTAFFLYVDFTLTENLLDVSVDLNSVLFAVVGITMIILGNCMPKLRKNSLIGLRTPRIMNDENLWKKSQRFGGITLIVGGLGVIVTSVLTKADLCLCISLGIILAVTLISVIYTYVIAK